MEMFRPGHKTSVAHRAAEELLPTGGTVAVLVLSLALRSRVKGPSRAVASPDERARVRGYQQRIRELVHETGLPRKSPREQTSSVRSPE
ncbi:hypothetical protein ABZ348_34095 [Streptomyces sp. NPDC005963]|uniref:hypothetical protein n=1 Tax=Streptomyces sp. NPDC005963 TaxID=3156721 RepID=UPI0033CF9FB6